MHILSVHCRYRILGGEDRALDAQNAALRELGHRVTELVVENPRGSLAAAASLAVSTWNPAAHHLVATAIRAHDPDLVHVHNTWFRLTDSVLHAARERPLVVSLHNYRRVCANGLLLRDGNPCRLCPTEGLHNGVLHRCYRGSAVQSAFSAAAVAWHNRRGTLLRHADAIIVPSEAARRELSGGGLPASLLEVVPNIVPDPGPRATPPSASGRYLFVGRVDLVKGIDVALDGWRRADLPQAVLDVVGPGELTQDLRALVTDSVRFHGEVDSATVAGLLAGSRALLYPTRALETFGLVVAEAMAAGTPVLMSPQSAAAGLAPPGWDAISVPENSPERWGRMLRRVHTELDVDALGREGRARYLSDLRPSEVAPALVGVYEGALAHGS